MKRTSPVVAVGVALTVVSSLFCVIEPAFIGELSLYVHDAFMRHAQKPQQSNRVVLVDIDEQSLDRYGPWPWPRHRIATLTQRLLDHGASVIAFSTVFAEPDRTSPATMQRELRQLNIHIEIQGLPDALSDFDRLLAETFRKSGGKIVLGCFVSPASGAQGQDLSQGGQMRESQYADINRFLVNAGTVVASIPVLSAEAAGNGFFNSWPDSDSVVRRAPLFVAQGPKLTYPALAIEAVRIADQVDQIGVEYEDSGIERIRLGNNYVPTDRSGRMLVNFRTAVGSGDERGFRSFPSYSARDVLLDEVSDNVFSNKIVFVGSSAPELKHGTATPLSPDLAGVEVHATVVDNILGGDVLHAPAWTQGVDMIAIVLLGLFQTILIYRGRALLSFIVAAVAMMSAVIAGFLLLRCVNLVYIPARPMVAIAMVYPVLTMIRYWQVELQKRHVRKMFGTMVSPDVLRYLENNPESFSLTGHRAEATMVFSDIVGFTPISEELAPSELSDLLNAYLSPMTQTIMERRGYVDKYEGDLIMAEWGVPFAMGDHAVQACLAVLEQREKLKILRMALKDRFGHDIHVRTGINSGSVIAGNMGSDSRFQYTVIGDAVNLARRLETANKDYGTDIIIGEATLVQARDVVEARLLDMIIVKGRTRPVRIYELVCEAGRLTAEQARVKALYEEALHFHWDRCWSDALELLEQALSILPGDGPCINMCNRLRAYEVNPPGPEWAGEHVQTDS